MYDKKNISWENVNVPSKARVRQDMRGIFEDRGHLIALMQGLLVTFLWSTSYVLVKIGLRNLSPLAFAAYRYILASTILLAALSLRGRKVHLTGKKDLPKLLFLGLSGYSVAQGLQFVGLYYLPVVTVSFLLNFTPIIVLLLSMVFLRELPVPLQLGGMALSLVGAYLFFLAPLSGMDLVGVAWTLLSGVGWAAYMISVGELMRGGRLSTFTTTALSMFFGAVPLLISAFFVEGLPVVSLWELAIILWLSVVNTAVAFSIWNHVLKKVRAFELSVLQNTMLIQTGILATIFLGETLTTTKIAAMILVFIGVLLVQTVRPRSL